MSSKRIIRPYQIPQYVSEIISQDDFVRGLTSVDSVVPIIGGVVHHIYEIRSGDKLYYLKIRGDNFSQLPEITCNPSDIALEHTALVRFGEVAFEYFPRVLSFNPEQFYMVLSNAASNGMTLEDFFLQEKTTLSMMQTYGRVLSTIHAATRDMFEPIRVQGDKQYYQILLEHRFGYRDNASLDNVVTKLTSLPDKQLVLGDPSPKNIGINGNGEQFVLFDLETAHIGDAVFDYAYALGHIVLHHLHKAEQVEDAINSYNQGYAGFQYFDNNIVSKVALGTILYRLEGIIPYQIPLSDHQKCLLTKNIKRMLKKNLIKVSWNTLLTEIYNE